MSCSANTRFRQDYGVADGATLPVMSHPTWNESYASGQLPWDTGQPEPLLVEFVTSGAVTPGSTLEIGAGTGTNAIWMAEHGFDVLRVDVSPLAVERAHTKLGERALRCRFAALDILDHATIVARTFRLRLP
jgi:2-polyprenyl-3-methyl-5-hydroxy-6-metoxy-1,4-benzoquinol methylase